MPPTRSAPKKSTRSLVERRIPHVALLIETSRSHGRSLLAGVRRYISEHEPWSIYMERRDLDSPLPAWLDGWRGDGILSRTSSPEMAAAVRRANVPTVELRSSRWKTGFPFLGVDNRSLGRLIVEHLMERGFRNFGVYSLGSEDFYEERCVNFIETVKQTGYECSVYRAVGQRETPVDWEGNQDAVVAWIRKLPKPVGIMAATDQLGFWLLDACKRADVAVPEAAAIVGVENDEALCTMSNPPLSSVAFNGPRMGYFAAELLDGMMRGGKAPAEKTFFDPLGLVTRQSSDIVAIDDIELAAAVRFIREHACEGIGVDDVLRSVPMSRSTLERKCRKVLGRSPNSEITRAQLLRVRDLLSETELSLAAIARKAGFNHPQYMCEIFKRIYAETPGAFRKRSQR